MIHPRPSPIAAALYTLRDLEVDVIIMHGPAGCCFRTGRLLEDEGIRVITTAMSENDFIFGAGEKLSKTIREVYETFKPENIGVVGTCASMIIGENMKKVIVVSKTHLDLGFTDFAESIRKKYLDEFIPNAIKTAESVNTKDKKFV